MALTRRKMIALGLGGVAARAARSFPHLFAQDSALLKPIPSTGERIPVIGIGTRDYEAETPQLRAELKEVLRRFPELGGKVIDTAAGYRRGASESLIGELTSELDNRDRLFLATKVAARGRMEGLDQIQRSFRRLRTDRIDLIAVHNLRDTAVQLEGLRQLQQEGKVRYIGITTSFERQYDEFESVMKAETLDFIQVDYAVDNRAAGDRLLPLAADRGMAVMINMPFGRRRLFSAVAGRQLPDWAGEIDCATWAQLFLKYIVSHPAVTCVIPGTRSVKHLEDNLQAGRGRMPDEALRRRMEELVDQL